MRVWLPALVTLAAIVGVTAAASATDPAASGRSSVTAAGAALRLVTVGRFDRPVEVKAAPGDDRRLFVVEQRGRLRVVRDGRQLDQPFLDLSAEVGCCGERGFLSVAFAPDYQTTGRLYVYYTDRAGDIRLVEYRRSATSADRADPGSRRSVMRIGHRRFANHNGGQLHFGPDGLLYLSPGDGGGSGDPLRNGQDLRSLLGKLLRIDPRPSGGRPYRSPRTNPFVRRRGARSEIYAYGLRNPFRFSFDRRTGDLALTDVGERTVDEINFAPRGRARGANYGWNRFEGRRRFSAGRVRGHVPPVLERPLSGGACALIGGYVVRDPELRGLAGRYVYSDLCLGQIRSAVLRRGRARGDRSTGVRVEQLSSFGEDGRGRIYVASLQGPVYRLAAP